MTNSDPIDPDLEQDLDDDPAVDAIALRRPSAPVTLSQLATLKTGEAIEIITSRGQILTTARFEAIRLTAETDYVLFKTPDGRIYAYLQDSGCRRVAPLFGIESFDIGTPEKIMGAAPNEFHYVIRGSGRCKLTGEVLEQIEGGRSSTEDFCRGKTGVDLELAVRKASRANLEGSLVRKLAGLGSIPAEDLERAGKKLDRCSKGRGFGTRDERVGADRLDPTNVPPPTCGVCGAVAVFRPGRDGRGAFYGCPNYTKHPDRKWTIDAEKWKAQAVPTAPAAPTPFFPAREPDTLGKVPAPKPPNGKPAAARPCEICGLPPEAHATADHDYDGGGPQ